MSDIGFVPTHQVPAGGLDAWAQPDPSTAPVARLDPWLEVAVRQQWNGWTEVLCSNGWTCWIDATYLTPVAAPTAYQPQPAQPAPYQAQAGQPAAPYSAPAYGTNGAVASYAQVYQYAHPTGRTPTDIVASASARQASTRRIAGAAIGGALVAIGALLPWIGNGSESIGSPDVPLQFLIDPQPTDNVVSLAVALIAAAVIGVIGSVNPKADVVRRVAGWVVVVLAAVFVAQVQRQISDFGGGPDAPSLLSTIGFGVYITTIGGLVMALSPKGTA